MSNLSRVPPASVGTFTLHSTRLAAIDPGYDSLDDGLVFDNARPGPWNAFVQVIETGSAGDRAVELMVIHSELSAYSALNFEPAGKVDVDGGQASFLDAGRWPGGENEAYFDAACAITDRTHAGCFADGAVSRSGWGDGDYECQVARDRDGRVIAARLSFDEGYGDDEDDGYAEDDEDEEDFDDLDEDEDDFDPTEVDDELDDEDPDA